MEGYKRVDPELPRLIMDRATREQKHRHEIDRSIADGHLDEAKAARDQVKRGQWLGAVVTTIMIVGAGYAAKQGQPWIGGPLAGGVIAGIIAVIVTGERAKHISRSGGKEGQI